MKMKITEELCQNVINVVKPGLCHGIGIAKPGDMCIEAAISYALGEGGDRDDPSCVDRDFREAKIILNDMGFWKNKKDRARNLLAVGIAQLGTKYHPCMGKFTETFCEEIYEQFFPRRPLSEVDFDYIENIESLSANFYLEFLGSISNRVDLIRMVGCLLRTAIKIKTPGSKYLYLLNKKANKI